MGIAVLGDQIIITDLSPMLILPYFIGILFSIFSIIGVCNAINIIDGFNGLTGGICLMIFIAIAVASFIISEDYR